MEIKHGKHWNLETWENLIAKGNQGRYLMNFNSFDQSFMKQSMFSCLFTNPFYYRKSSLNHLMVHIFIAFFIYANTFVKKQRSERNQTRTLLKLVDFLNYLSKNI